MPDHVAPEQPAAAAEAVATAAKDAYPRIVATLIRVTGDWTLAEDCAQDALALALQRWPDDGVPANPGGWLMTVARNRAIDLLRRASVERRRDGDPAFADEAIRLARLLDQLMPAESEVSALLALFLLQHSRRDARHDSHGNLLTLDEQDRKR